VLILVLLVMTDSFHNVSFYLYLLIGKAASGM